MRTPVMPADDPELVEESRGAVRNLVGSDGALALESTRG